MKFVVEVKIKKDADMAKVKALQKEELLAIWQMHKDGFITSLSTRSDSGAVFAEVECASREELISRMENLPMRLVDLNEYEIIPLVPFVKFENLWNKA